MTDTQFQVKALIAACRTLCTQALELALKTGSSTGLRTQLHSAKRCVDLAHMSLAGDDQGVLTETSTRAHIAANVADHLLNTIPSDSGERSPSSETPSDPDGEVGFSGSTAVIAIPDLLSFLQLQSKTGLLKLSLQDENILLEFQRGELMHASSDRSPVGSRLGEILVKQGAIEAERLRSFMESCSSNAGRLGNALATEQLVTHSHLRRALEFQVQQIFNRLFSAGHAGFKFLTRDSSELAGGLRLNVMRLLLESARVKDDAQHARKAD